MYAKKIDAGRAFGMDQFKCKLSWNIRQGSRITLCAFDLRLGRGVSPNSQLIDESHLDFRSPGNRMRYPRRMSGVRWPTRYGLHPPVEHQRRVHVPVQEVELEGGRSFPTAKHKVSIATRISSGLGAGLLNTSRAGTFSQFGGLRSRRRR